MTAARDWYKDAVFYEVHVKAFMDGNGDGVGDFAGLTERLDYLAELGVDCLWILPMYASPLRDDGYDIADFFAVHPAYGTLEDFQKFLDAAHARGLRVIADLVMNHTSDAHPWFQASRADPASPYADYYVWDATDRRYTDARVIFVDAEKSNWTWDPQRKAYYWHRFFSHQPDLNYDNPTVRRAMLDVMRFWLDRGLDGFRCDAVPYLVERDGTSCENLPETHAVLKELRAVIDHEYGGDRLLLAEANQWPEDVRPYFGDGDEFHMAFNFPLMPRLYMALRLEERRPIVDIYTHTPPIPPGCQWGLFLRNHDELTLEMVTNEERAFMYYAYAQDPEMKLNLGIRRRLAPLVDNDRRRIELLNCLLLTLPGSPIIYYGDEIGMGDNVYLGDRNGVRTPMQWSSDRNGGFSTAAEGTLYLPVIADPVYGYQAVNVAAQARQPASLLSTMRRLIAARRTSPVFGRGTIAFLRPRNQKVLAYLRRHGRETVLIVANLSGAPQPAELDLAEFAGVRPIEILGDTVFPPIQAAPYVVSVGPHGFYWFRLDRSDGAEEPYGIESTAI
ncbi:MAG: maltose alpha-D-glucosyltransferase [Candidatus Rokubacteria bacterium 13_1_40CM_4_69_39]|nr:MAG: maltose alpha-D-glucosyltransferase [Candidatus Rokubacteria bacterium 13_2_20CM_70_12]OLC51522.1 MAG: maltose alpha-D-glucosyltransferase [Candidatus Rokubacteria bacterium 13_1_40CM_4_69_39]OLC92671.1 MAG: maltose alpha-D-glucosyltransferase [Candidatus Rokubacteria bacterium 13_1_40CM_3_69_38]OLD30777.1 MAG: maltose alpha-D-glucosyltransferase [Candidatus Rokubacteria bacterium 13_1_40CM_2_70_45]OLD75350.1 MAG: maltose alpha-D-glucosyltransferase [Candidatus Rokubacteria bacterium 13